MIMLLCEYEHDGLLDETCWQLVKCKPTLSVKIVTLEQFDMNPVFSVIWTVSVTETKED